MSLVKRALVVVRYDDESELNKFFEESKHLVAHVSVSDFYENLDAADIEHLGDFIEREIIDDDDDE